ncbi:phosphoenolpyruvate synthase [Mycolicibacterium wolinskyi]|uniref:Phosphoenolpyruvate synthase n=1 Tax=Mycolicibacterium wolinskyi TaxID=59750 RepID=A0A1X2F9S6_9MYCO|nr:MULTISPECIES: rifamycin-inactivating phosphotransferase [Mycolicibacterium]MCV7290460.1 phosphoenolpyruvate synthase [Mycolicibacterium wolinskyi]MCV7297020.1 phosphoenolpyruvate synthase [Mycolicibacterium goodii]ORX15176.1 phosphoenolpyruvate synthase [Mycolicibacterium wolinskyi]
MAYVVGLDEVDRTSVAMVGGKGARLGELSGIAGVQVPDGFCVTTEAFRRFMADVPPGGSIDETEMPADIAAAVIDALERVGVDGSYAVRSSATTEDSAAASFAGQLDSYLNVVGPAAVLDHVKRCWASLFTERAMVYRQRTGVDHRQVHMAVVVQRMVPAQAAGVLFTADPVSGHRRVAAIEAVFGLGEALVSGRAEPDRYTVRDGEVVARIATEHPTLNDAQALRLSELGRRIEAHFGCPQDIEWCLLDDAFHIVQARPITTLFPIPEQQDGQNHVYLSVGHQQMMTDPMKPLGLSVWQLTTPRPMAEAGGRLFVDVAKLLQSPRSRANFLAGFGRSDPLIADALRTVLDRGFIDTVPDVDQEPAPSAAQAAIETDPAVVVELIEENQAAVAALRCNIQTKSGPELLDFIRADIADLQQTLFAPRSHQVIMAGMDAAQWLNDHLQEWLGEKNAADVLTQSVPHNVTSEMGLALLDVADAIRPHPEVVAFLRRVAAEGSDDLADLTTVAGGLDAHQAFEAFLDKYGMRCVGEIDITRPRWRERPATLVPTILANVDNFEPGAAARRFEEGLRQADSKERELLGRLRALPDGERKAAETERMIRRVRNFAGYREYPKYGMVSRYFIYKQALLREAGRLVEAQVLHAPDDVFYLRFDELYEVMRTNSADHELIQDRRSAFQTYEALRPPRVLTSDGEAVAGSYRRADLPPDALVGLAVSAGTVEGRARVVVDIEQAQLEPGDILVTAYTDPSWTPLFVGIAGLVTEVGGLMTHGAVIAREYGLPAVVGVENATTLIRDGQRIRLHGTEGYVEMLS